MNTLIKNNQKFIVSSKQMEIISGSLLGDAWIYAVKGHDNWACKFGKTQSLKDCKGKDKISYMQWTWNELLPFSNSISKSKLSYQFVTYTDECFTKLERSWYLRRENGDYVLNHNNQRKKIVPIDLKLTPLILCVWHMDDGSVYAKDANLTLETQGFALAEVDFLIDRLKEDLDIKATKKKAKKDDQFRIYVGRKSYFDFIDIIKPHVQWDCFKYKIDDITYNKIEQIGENHSQSKISETNAKEIFSLRDQGLLHREIAERFKVSQASVTQILNGKRWGHLNKCIVPRTVKRMSEEQKNKVKTMLKQNISQKAIAEELGINQSTVSRIGEKCQE